MHRMKPAAIAALIIYIAATTGCSSPQAQSEGPVIPAVPVTTGQAVEESVPIQIRTVGTVEPYSSVEVKAQVAGQLMKVKFSEVSNVNQGGSLLEIDPRRLREVLRHGE